MSDKAIFDKIEELKSLVDFRTMELSTFAKRLYGDMKNRVKECVEKESKSQEAAVRQREKEILDAWDVFFRNLLKKITAGLSSPAASAPGLNFAPDVANHMSDLTSRFSELMFEEAVQNGISGFESYPPIQKELNEFYTEFLELKKGIQGEVDRLSKEIIGRFRSPFSGGVNGVYTKKPEVAVTPDDEVELLGCESVVLKDENRKVVFNGKYPVAVNRNRLVVISYQSNDDPQGEQAKVEANTSAYLTIRDILANMCFQELCRHLGDNSGRNMHIHIWHSDNANNIAINEAFKLAQIADGFISNEGDNRLYNQNADLSARLQEWRNRHSSRKYPFEFVVIFYDPNYNAGFRDENLRAVIAELAKLRLHNIFTVCICREKDLEDFQKPVPTCDNVNLLDPKNTGAFETDHIALGERGIMNRKGAASGLNISPIRSFDADAADDREFNFNCHSLHMLISPPPQQPVGGVKIPVGTLNSHPYFWYYDASGGPPDNAYISGLTGSGKTYWLTEALSYLASNYTPDEVNIYLCCLADKGVQDIKPWCESIPHVVLSVISTLPTYFKILMNKLKREYLSRQKKFGIMRQRLNERSIANIDVYHKNAAAHPELDFEPLPMIFLIIDEVSKLLKASDDYKALFEEFKKSLEIIRSSGIFVLIANQTHDIFNLKGLLKCHLELAAPDENTRTKTVHALGESYPSIQLDPVAKESGKPGPTDDERLNALEAKMKTSAKKSYIKNIFYTEPDNAVLALPNSKDVPATKEMFAFVAQSSAPNKLCIFSGISFGKLGNMGLETCFTDPFFIKFDKCTDGKDQPGGNRTAGKNLLVVNRRDGLNTAFWTQILYSVLVQKAAKCAVSFYDPGCFTQEVQEEITSFRSSSKVSFPQTVPELLEKIGEWENHAAGKNTDGCDFNILIINMESAEEAFRAQDNGDPAEAPPPQDPLKAKLVAIVKQNNGVAVVKNAKPYPPTDDASRPAAALRPDEPPPLHPEKSFEDFKKKILALKCKRSAASSGAYIFLQTEEEFENVFAGALKERRSDVFIDKSDVCIAFNSSITIKMSPSKFLNKIPGEITEVGYYFPEPAKKPSTDNEKSFERIIPVSPDSIREIAKEMEEK